MLIKKTQSFKGNQCCYFSSQPCGYAVRNRLGTGSGIARSKAKAKAGSKGTGQHTKFEVDDHDGTDSELDWDQGHNSSSKSNKNKKRLRDADDFNRQRAHNSARSPGADEDQDYMGRRKRQKMRVVPEDAHRKQFGGTGNGKPSPQQQGSFKSNQSRGAAGGHGTKFTVTINHPKKAAGKPMFKKLGGNPNSGRHRGR